MRWLALLLVCSTLLGSAHAATMLAAPEEMHDDGARPALLILACTVVVALAVAAVRHRPRLTIVRIVAPSPASAPSSWTPAPQRIDGSARASPAWLQRFLR